MIDIVKSKIATEKYCASDSCKYVKAYRNVKNTWINYLIDEQIIFSHRKNDYTQTQFPEHLHTHEYWELTINIGDGDIQYITDYKYLSSKKGTVILTPPFTTHMYRPIAPNCYDRYIIYFKNNLSITPSLNNKFMNFMNIGDTDTLIYLNLPENEITNIISRLNRAEKSLHRDEKYSEAMAFWEIAGVFLTLSQCNSDPKNKNEIPLLYIPEFIQEIKQYIDDNFLDIKSVDDLAKNFFYTREHITRSFKKYYNTAIYEYILQRKILNSCTLLNQGITVERAAELSGFNNMSSFIKIFKKHIGKTPSEYKNQQ